MSGPLRLSQLGWPLRLSQLPAVPAAVQDTHLNNFLRHCAPCPPLYCSSLSAHTRLYLSVTKRTREERLALFNSYEVSPPT